jgi:lysyl-tRNA synthetase class 2
MSGANIRRSWRPTATLETAQLRASMLATARKFFAEHNILEVETPVLARAAVSDPNIESVGATLTVDPAHRYFLHTSPEFAMKRLLCAGWPDIYQICKVFRDGEVGERHQPEFTMIEWYRRDLGLQAMISHTLHLLCQLLDLEQAALKVESLSYRDAFRQWLDLDPFTASIAKLQRASGADKHLVHALGNHRDDWLDLLLSTKIAPQFKPSSMVVLHHYPASQAALARICPGDPQVADRFEVFCGELELANGYYELADAGEQQRRCEQEQRLRLRQALPQRPLDAEFLTALRAGLPHCCGVAVGFDRLVMLRRRTGRLRDVQTFTIVDTQHD